MQTHSRSVLVNKSSSSPRSEAAGGGRPAPDGTGRRIPRPAILAGLLALPAAAMLLAAALPARAAGEPAADSSAAPRAASTDSTAKIEAALHANPWLIFPTPGVAHHEEAPPSRPTEWPYREAPTAPAGYQVNAMIKSLTFARRSAGLDGEARAVIRMAAEEAAQHPDWRLVVVGQTDGVAEVDRAQALGRERAEAVARVLVSGGVPGGHVSVMSFGNEYAGSDAVQFVILSPDRKVEVWAFEN